MKKNDFQQIKSSVRIEEVIGGYQHLEPKGKNYVGLCPFHPDHHPSLMVNPEKQTYSCFACGEHGDVFEFVRKMEHCTLSDAVRKLAAGRFAEGKPDFVMPGTGRLAIKRQAKQSAKDFAAFMKLLLPYACGCTELSAAYLDFEVGMSPVQVPAEWKVMRNRIIFPVRDEYGKLVGMGARRLCDEDTSVPKYINSSAADGYDKGATLYGLNRAVAVIRKEDYVFITEGYKDAIAMHAAGFVNTVALCGTALTDSHIALLKKYTNRACLLLDGDEAGQAASKKAVLRLREAGMDADSALIPGGGDPDSLFRRSGKEAFVSLIDKFLSKPHLSEEMLLTACLLFPETLYMFKGSSCLFTELVKSILQTDDLLFENKENRMILEHLGTGNPEPGLTPALKSIVNELHVEYDQLVYNEKELFGALYPEASNILNIYLTRLLFLYLENRILQEIQKSVHRLLETDPKKKKIRLDILVNIAKRREQLRHVSENLDRPGAVWG